MADVAATLAGWSSTTASNAPAGATSIGTGLDDNLREIQGVVTRGLSHKGADIASVAGTMDIGAVEGLMHDITGANAITGLGTVRAGILKVLKFEGAATLTHNATSLILPGGANILCANGDVGIFISEGSGNWRCLAFMPAALTPKRPVLGTAQASTSGTSIDFTGIPAGTKRIVISFVGVSTNGTSIPLVQLGDGAIETTGYVSGASLQQNSGSNVYTSSTAGFVLNPNGSANAVNQGSMVLTLVDATAFTWVASYSGNDSGVTASVHGGGSKSLSSELDRVRITTAGGTDTFDAGTINILYE